MIWPSRVATAASLPSGRKASDSTAWRREKEGAKEREREREGREEREGGKRERERERGTEREEGGGRDGRE